MFNRKMTYALATVTMFAAPVAMAAPILIDDFDDAFTTEVRHTGGLQGAEVIAPVLGGARDLFVETSPIATGGTSLLVENGDISFNNNSQQSGFGQIVYDGVDGVPTGFGDIDITGLGGIDLTFGFTSASFFFEVLAADGDFDFRATVWDMMGNFHTYVENIFDASFSPFLSFNEFTSNGVDMTDVGAISFEVQSNGVDSVDGTIGSISVVPLPASALLLLGGLGGLAGMGAAKRRRRRKS